MEYKSNEIKVGLVVIISVGLLVGFLVSIFGLNLGKETKTYVTHLNYIGGIQKGSLVKFGGMDVGLVKDISLPEGGETQIGVVLEIDSKTPVHMDSEAYLTSVGIMADKHIEISPGTRGAPLLPDGSVLPGKEVLGFTQMTEPMSALTEKMQVLLDRVAEMFNDENRTHLTSMMASMDELMADGGKQFVQLMTNLDTLTANMATMSSDLKQLMDNNGENFEQTIGHIESTTKETGELIRDLRKTLGQFELLMTTNGGSLVEIMENFQYASQNFEEFTKMVKERPWLLVRKDAPPVRKVGN